MPSEGPNAFSPRTGDLLISSDESGVYNAYRLKLTTGERTALTQSDTSPIFALSWFLDDDRFLYSQDGGGDELDHVYVRLESGESVDLTPGEQLKAGLVGWQADGSAFYLFSNERDPQAFDVYRYSTEDYSRQRIYENTGTYALGSLSSDGRFLVLEKTYTFANSDLYLVDLTEQNAQAKLITAHEGDVAVSSYTFNPSDTAIIYATNAYGEFEQAWQYELATGEHTPLIAEDWDVMYVSYSPSGRYRVSAVNDDARTAVTIHDASSDKTVEMDGLPDGNPYGVRFSRDESAIAFTLDSDTAPSDIYHMPLDGSSARKLTNALNPAIESARLAEGKIARFESYDGLSIPGILYRPHQASADSPVPALVYVHGGPGDQSRRWYDPDIQHLVNHGYAIYAINNRGSSGYGKTFYHLDDQQHGEADLGDVVASRDFLARMDWIDGERIGIFGYSYGGYMVAAALAFEPEAFAVGINLFGVTNWVRTLSSMPEWWGDERDALFAELGNPETDKERLYRISPLFHAENIVRPLLVVQGANDPRVLKVESDELVANVRANGVPVEYVLFDDEGHGFRSRKNRITASEAYLRFLDSYLGSANDEAAADISTDTTTVYLVRHAEKAADGSRDPALTNMGEQRAITFAEMLRGKPLTHVFSTPYTRTRQTATPTAIAHGLEIEEYDPSEAEKMVSKLKTLTGTILVTGHSNTIPGLVNLLTGETFADLDESVYDHVFIVSINEKGSAQLRLDYTEPRTPAPAEFKAMRAQP
jgi:dipeptidyl aminopeptidase/acylaminoacyl peptidase/phosphohistidine phosphatase SixA